MNKILPGIGIGIVVIIYFVGFEIGNNQEFLEITDHEIIQEKGRSLFLSATIFEKIPEKSEMSNYGFWWFNESSGKLNGYTTNIHSDSKWHTESIVINDTKQFCFDDAKLVESNVIIDQNKINVVVNQYDSTNFDKIISYEIIKDSNCFYM